MRPKWTFDPLQKEGTFLDMALTLLMIMSTYFDLLYCTLDLPKVKPGLVRICLGDKRNRNTLHPRTRLRPLSRDRQIEPSLNQADLGRDGNTLHIRTWLRPLTERQWSSRMVTLTCHCLLYLSLVLSEETWRTKEIETPCGLVHG